MGICYVMLRYLKILLFSGTMDTSRRFSSQVKMHSVGTVVVIVLLMLVSIHHPYPKNKRRISKYIRGIKIQNYSCIVTLFVSKMHAELPLKLRCLFYVKITKIPMLIHKIYILSYACINFVVLFLTSLPIWLYENSYLYISDSQSRQQFFF